MKDSKVILILALILSFMLFVTACSSKGNASSPDDEQIQKENLQTITDVTNTTQEETSPKKVEDEDPLTEAIENEPTNKVNFGFEGDMEGWQLSNWESETDGELGCISAEISAEQKASGSSSVAIACDFKGQLGSSKTTKGAFKINFDEPIDLSGKILSVKVYVPEDLQAEQFISAPYGFKLYIKTTDNWTWSDGGWVDIPNTLQPGWNEIIFAPIGVKEKETREIGIQISKGDNSPDWSGTIYIDDISY